ncbi:CopG family transcriptional regulator [Candidatus Poriferisocius sp.]|uniref:ribbon-helix-helix domain-containing protein n=1 Tax=Candidatus Poriferisocius sp. TaxID=3101276 RepID=UPI003B5B0B0C
MRRIQLYLDEEVDEVLTAEAARRGTSRSSLLREAIRASLADQLQATTDPVDELIGRVDVDPDEDLDAVIYGLAE